MMTLENFSDHEYVLADSIKGKYAFFWWKDIEAIIVCRVLFVKYDLNDAKYATKDAVNKFVKRYKRAYDTIIINRDAVEFSSFSV